MISSVACLLNIVSVLSASAFSPVSWRLTILPFSVTTVSVTVSSDDCSVDQPISLPDSTYTPILIKSLTPIAFKLRQHYDDHFQDPRQPAENRFIWDPWLVRVGDVGTRTRTEIFKEGVPGEAEATRNQIQYSLKRLPASSLFDNDDLYEQLVDDLTELASSIGLTAITPPWVSMYLEGDMQNFHTDAPQGPMAYVLSLCIDGSFQGGETMILNPSMLEYWRGFDGTKGLECGSIVRFIPPSPLGRCLVFDPRVPHGVNRVTGTQDPRQGRLVVHGWFNEPQVCWFGPWKKEQQQVLDTALELLVEDLGTGDIGRVMGYLAVRISVTADGSVGEVSAVCDTLQADLDDFRGIIGYNQADEPIAEDAVADIRLTIMDALMPLEFGSDGGGARSVVVPFFFE